MKSPPLARQPRNPSPPEFASIPQCRNFGATNRNPRTENPEPKTENPQPETDMLDQIAQLTHLWVAGGWLMIPLLFIAFFIYGAALQLVVYFSKRGFRRVPQKEWERWTLNPEEGRGEVGEIVRYTQDEARSKDEIQDRFSEIVSAKLPEIDRRLVFMNVMVAAAPLLGLLGTVLGMISTFDGISGGGAKTADLIASGISQALITTEMGLLVAIPGYALAYLVKARRDEYEAFLAKLESFALLTFDGGNGSRAAASGVTSTAEESVADDDLMGAAWAA